MEDTRRFIIISSGSLWGLILWQSISQSLKIRTIITVPLSKALNTMLLQKLSALYHCLSNRQWWAIRGYRAFSAEKLLFIDYLGII